MLMRNSHPPDGPITDVNSDEHLAKTVAMALLRVLLQDLEKYTSLPKPMCFRTSDRVEYQAMCSPAIRCDHPCDSIEGETP